jgi:hypothetical protein
MVPCRRSAEPVRALVGVVSFGFFVLGTASPVAAEPLECQQTIAKAGAQLLQATAKALTKCAGAVVKGSIPGPCPDAKATAAIEKATAKFRGAVDVACGGVDEVCGGDRIGEDAPGSLGWPTKCPNLARGDCANAITHCGDIATCVACTTRSAAEQTRALAYDDLALPSSGALEKCQGTIGKATLAFLAAHRKALQKCWDARIRGKHGDACVPPAVADGKYQDAIGKAEAKKLKAICKACGGADRVCGTPDDLTPAAIGFPASCPAATIPGGTACGGPVDTLTDLATCVDCLAAFQSTCVDRLALPGFTPYPSACGTCLAPPPSGPCPTAFEFTAEGPLVDLDTGWTGLAHDAQVPPNGRLTLAVSDCAGVSQPTCGECTVSGPVENTGGPTFDNHRCADASWIACDVDADCTNAGALGPCTFFFGAPLPLVAGGVASCVLNRVAEPVTGTVDVEAGFSTTHVVLSSQVHVGSNSISQPCPVCNAGTCSGGERGALPCVPQGPSRFGTVSLDCPPAAGTRVGTLAIDLALGTGSQTRTLSMASPQCTAGAEYAGFRCHCDTCNNGDAQACATNADCPPSGGNPGICGGRRCFSGGNAGAPCSAASQCPGGSCGRSGLPTQPHACLDDSNTPIDGFICQDVGGNEGECADGPVTARCSIETFRTCGSDAECNPGPGSSCPSCLAGQTCVAQNRPCFTGAGNVGDAVQVSGAPDVPCGEISHPTVSSFFCVGPTGYPAVDTAAGLPGLGRVRIPGRVVVAP